MEDSIINSERRKYFKSVSVDTSYTSTSSSNLEQPSSKKLIKQTEKNSFNDKTNYSYKEKLSILKKLDFVAEKTVTDEYKISDRTLRRWKNERAKIEEMCSKDNTQERKKIKLSNEDLDEAVYLWFCQCRSNGVPVSGPMIKQKALDLNKQLGGNESFKASEGWLDKWKSRMKIRSIRIAGEKLSADVDAAEIYKKSFAQDIKIRQLTKAQIFNFDETPLVFKSLPVKTFVCHKEDHASGFKISKERYTVGACCNADGSLKLPLVVIGKFAKPRALKNLSASSLGVYYKSQKNAWMDSELFEEWFKNEFVPRVRAFLLERNLPLKALLVVDNCKAHTFLKVGDIEITFLPANVTSLIQPLDQGILETLKRHYKAQLLLSIIKDQENKISLPAHLKTLTIRDVISWISAAWKDVSEITIYKCWKKLLVTEYKDAATQTDEEFVSLTSLDFDNVGAETVESAFYGSHRTTQEMYSNLQKINGFENISLEATQNWITTDDDVPDTEDVTDYGILHQLQNIRDEKFFNDLREHPIPLPSQDDGSLLLSESFNVLYPAEF